MDFIEVHSPWIQRFLECRDCDGIWRNVLVKQTSLCIDTCDNRVSGHILAADVIFCPNGLSKEPNSRGDLIIMSFASGHIEVCSIGRDCKILWLRAFNMSSGMVAGEDARMLGSRMSFNVDLNGEGRLFIGATYERLRVLWLEYNGHELLEKNEYNETIPGCVILGMAFRRNTSDPKTAEHRKYDNLGYYLCFAGNGRVFLRLCRSAADMVPSTLIFPVDCEVPLGILAVENGLVMIFERRVLYVKDSLFSQESGEIQDLEYFAYSCTLPSLCVSWCTDERGEPYIGTIEGQIFWVRIDQETDKIWLELLVSMDEDIGTCLAVVNKPANKLVLRYGGDCSQGKAYVIERTDNLEYLATEIANYPNWTPLLDVIRVSHDNVNREPDLFAVVGQKDTGRLVKMKSGRRLRLENNTEVGLKDVSRMRYVAIDDTLGLLFLSMHWSCEVFRVEWSLEPADMGRGTQGYTSSEALDNDDNDDDDIYNGGDFTLDANEENNNDYETNENEDDSMSVEESNGNNKRSTAENPEEHMEFIRKLRRITRLDTNLPGAMLSVGLGTNCVQYVCQSALIAMNPANVEEVLVQNSFAEPIALASIEGDVVALIADSTDRSKVEVMNMASSTSASLSVSSEISCVKLEIIFGRLYCFIGTIDCKIGALEILQSPSIKLGQMFWFDVSEKHKFVPQSTLVTRSFDNIFKLIVTGRGGEIVSCTLSFGDDDDDITISHMISCKASVIGAELEPLDSEQILICGDDYFISSNITVLHKWQPLVPERLDSSSERLLICPTYVNTGNESNKNGLDDKLTFFIMKGGILFLARMDRTRSLTMTQAILTNDGEAYSPRRVIYLKSIDALCILFRENRLPMFIERKSMNILNYTVEHKQILDLVGHIYCFEATRDGRTLVFGGTRGICRVDVSRVPKKRRELLCSAVWQTGTPGATHAVAVSDSVVYYALEDPDNKTESLLRTRSIEPRVGDECPSVKLRSSVVQLSVHGTTVFASTMKSSIFVLNVEVVENFGLELQVEQADAVNRSSVAHFVFQNGSNLEILLSDRAGQVTWLRRCNPPSTTLITMKVWKVPYIVVRFLATNEPTMVEAYSLGGSVYKLPIKEENSFQTM